MKMIRNLVLALALCLPGVTRGALLLSDLLSTNGASIVTNVMWTEPSQELFRFVVVQDLTLNFINTNTTWVGDVDTIYASNFGFSRIIDCTVFMRSNNTPVFVRPNFDGSQLLSFQNTNAIGGPLLGQGAWANKSMLGSQTNLGLGNSYRFILRGVR